MLTKDQKFNLVIIGGGPNCTYTMERLAADLSVSSPSANLEIHVIEQSGYFGAGVIHSPAQPVSSMLNRIVGQITFSADESNLKARNLLPKNYRPTFYEWCRRKYDETSDPRFDLTPEDWPSRCLHGMALVEMFNSYVKLLNEIPNVNVYLHYTEAIDVEECEGRYLVYNKDMKQGIFADHILFLTGHSCNKPRINSYQAHMTQFAEQSSAFNYIPFAYPLESMISNSSTATDKVVGCVGLGLTAIDVFLFLTEGRGGRFVRSSETKRLVYHSCGKEPCPFGKRAWN